MYSFRPLQLIALASCLFACGSEDPLGPGGGRIRVTLALAGLDPDPDGALVSLDDATPVAVADTSAIVFRAGAGHHRITIDGLSSNCVPVGGATRSLEVREGDLVDLAFLVNCTASTGVVEVTVVTQGMDVDPDGYLITIAASPPQRIWTSSVTRFAPIPGGSHLVSVLDVAANCAVQGGNPLPNVQVNTGGSVRDTARVTVTVLCTSLHGTLQVITTTSGPPDPDGYLIILDTLPGQSARLGPTDTLVLSNLSVGTYPLHITDVADNCTVSGAPPSAGVTVVGGQVTVATFLVDCAPPAVLRVSAPTTGPNPDPGYLVRVDGGSPHPLVTGDTLSLDVLPGPHLVSLEDVAANCSVGVANPASVTVSGPTELSFPVTCVTAGRSGFDFTVTTTGVPTDPYYYLEICADFYCWEQIIRTFMLPNSTLQVDAPAGSYQIYFHVARNCQYTWAGGVTVMQSQVTDIRIDVTCLESANLAATVSATGTDLQNWFSLWVDGSPVGFAQAGVPFLVSSLEGTRSVELRSVGPNCQVTSPNPVNLTLVAGTVTPVSFSVFCQAYPVVNVSVSTAGTNIPASFLVGVDWDLFYGYWYSTAITPNGSVTFRLNPLGSHTIWLDQVPANCTVNAPNPVALSPALGSVTDISFTVVCQ